jgi:nitrate reductase NapE component
MARIVNWPRLGSMRQRTFAASALAFVLGLVISLAWSLVGGYGF